MASFYSCDMNTIKVKVVGSENVIVQSYGNHIFYNKMGAAAQEMVLEYRLRCPKRGFIALVVVKLAEIA